MLIELSDGYGPSGPGGVVSNLRRQAQQRITSWISAAALVCRSGLLLTRWGGDGFGNCGGLRSGGRGYLFFELFY